MKGFLRHLTASAVAILLIAGFTAGTAQFARAGDAAPEAGSIPTEPAMAADFGGCWSGITAYGYLQDKNYGQGFGYLYIVQEGNKILGGDSYLEFVWYDNGGYPYASGYFSGKVSGDKFTANIKFQHGCKIAIDGKFGGDGIEGAYKEESCGRYDYYPKGTFNLPGEAIDYCDYFTP